MKKIIIFMGLMIAIHGMPSFANPDDPELQEAAARNLHVLRDCALVYEEAPAWWHVRASSRSRTRRYR